MPKAKPQNFMVGAVMYALLFAGGAEKIGGSDNDNKCGGEDHWNEKVLIDTGAPPVNQSIETATIQQLTHTIGASISLCLIIYASLSKFHTTVLTMYNLVVFKSYR